MFKIYLKQNKQKIEKQKASQVPQYLSKMSQKTVENDTKLSQISLKMCPKKSEPFKIIKISPKMTKMSELIQKLLMIIPKKNKPKFAWNYS